MHHLLRHWLLAVGLFSGLCWAQEDNGDALYNAAAPADSAFVRVLNLDEANVNVALSGKNNAQLIAGGQLGAYRFTPPGPTQLHIGTQTLNQNLEANTAYTFVYNGQSVLTLKDAFVNEPKKAQIGFYNLSEQTLALKTADGRHAIVDNVAASSNGGRMVNELKIAFSVYNGSEAVAQYPEVFLKKGRTYSYLIVPSSNGVRAITAANTLDPLD